MLRCNCSFNNCNASFIQKQRVEEEWMRPWKIRISWNIIRIKQNFISGRAFVFDYTIWFRIFHLDHYFFNFWWISCKTADGKEAIRKRRPPCFTHNRRWKEFFYFDFLLQEAGNAWSGNWNLWGKWMLIVRLIYEERSFDLVGNYVLYNIFRLFNSSMVKFFVFSFSTFFSFFQPFSTFFTSVFNFFQPFSTFFNFVPKL